MIEIIVCALILVSVNILTIVWALKFRMPKHPQVAALLAAVQSFERNGTTLLRIEKIDPDHIFMRNPNR